ncbi:hypothetical protein SADUNF_Sadunf19G0071700 [Salix dunnii]|uniref:Xylanase inhibitor C-terminal domain-containing protein n=1 Tax=Salix dunnii TaxID=1413687 RepID=A0A835J5Y9_9ROSI|nr:hypothetical protein SADUNF_Sadunf19G0071700 [Salix dunnii]
MELAALLDPLHLTHKGLRESGGVQSQWKGGGLKPTLITIDCKNGYGGTKISIVVPYTKLETSIYQKLGFSSSILPKGTYCANFKFSPKQV